MNMPPWIDGLKRGALDTVALVAEFHRGFDQPHEESPHIPEQGHDVERATLRLVRKMEELGKEIHQTALDLGGDPILLRLQLMQEEIGEVGRALVNRDLENLLKELCDVRYVVDGTTLTLGLQDAFEPAFAAVHKSNMSKLVDGRPVKDAAGRAQKGPGYSPPDLAPILNLGGKER